MKMFLPIILSFFSFLVFASSVDSLAFLPFLNFTSSSPYIFHSLATLLQTYPQNLFPNGHTIASVTIPRHTLLYHGRHDNDSVPSPEWLALDIEMAYGIMGSMPDSRMLTYRTTKDIKAVYFDGASANLMDGGTTSQMVFLYNGSDNIPKRGGWGPPPGRGGGHGNDPRHRTSADDSDEPPTRPPPGRWNPLEDEYMRARGLCWLVTRGLGGRGWGYEGIVRMNAGFEVIWCDFESPSLRLLSNLNVSAPRLDAPILDLAERSQVSPNSETQARLRVNEDEGPHGPGLTDPREPFRDTATWFWFSAAAKRYFGDSRIKVNRCGLFSFYEAGLHNQSQARAEEDTVRLNLTHDGQWKSPKDASARHLGLQQLTRRRRHHILDHVAKKDGQYMQQASEQRLKNVLRGEDGCEEVDWHYVAQDIVTRYSSEIQSLHQVLSKGFQNPSRDWLRSTRALTHSLLLPFLEYPPDRPYDAVTLRENFDLGSPLSLATLARCMEQYGINDDEGNDANMSGAAVKETMGGICSTVIEIGLDVEYQWLLNFNKEPTDNEQEQARTQSELESSARLWKVKLEELMAWLGWAEKWSPAGCSDSCGADELCYIPMWPTAGFPRMRRPSPPPPGKDDSLRDFAAPHWGWFESKYIWEPVCVNASNYPPEE